MRLVLSHLKGQRRYIYIPNAIELDKTKIWDYNTIPHGLIAGSTGSGKTYFLNYIICNLLANDADITFIDPKSADIKTVGELVNPQKTACTENQIAKLVREFSEEMEARQEIIGKSGKVNATYLDFGMKPQFLIFDELAAFKAGCIHQTLDKRGWVIYHQLEWNHISSMV